MQRVVGTGGVFLRSSDPEGLDSQRLGRPDQAVMVDFRVRDLDRMLAQPAAAGVALDGDVVEAPGVDGSRTSSIPPAPGSSSRSRLATRGRPSRAGAA